MHLPIEEVTLWLATGSREKLFVDRLLANLITQYSIQEMCASIIINMNKPVQFVGLKFIVPETNSNEYFF